MLKKNQGSNVFLREKNNIFHNICYRLGVENISVKP